MTVMKVVRMEVPADGRVHGLRMTGHIIHVECLEPGVLTLWVTDGGYAGMMRYFRVYRDDEPILTDIPGGVWHVRTVRDGDITFWHLFQGLREDLLRGAKNLS